MAATEALAGRKVLLVEDDFFIADEIVRTLEEGGADVVGPAVSVQGALELMGKCSARRRGARRQPRWGEVYPVADALAKRGVPFMFATSSSKEMIPRRYAAVDKHAASSSTRGGLLKHCSHELAHLLAIQKVVKECASRAARAGTEEAPVGDTGRLR